jgi:hypothetical protein
MSHKPKKSVVKRVTAPLLRALSYAGNTVYPVRNAAPIVISGSPRGGTTWLAETIAKAYQSERMLWEPLQDGNIAKDGLGLTKRPFIDEQTAAPEVESFFHSLLHAKQANAHLIRLRKYPKNMLTLVRNQRLFIKFVCGNGVVGYLRRRFGIPTPLVILRHPCAVVASQLRMGQWEDHPHIDPELLKRKPELADIIDHKAPLAERLAMTWVGDVLAAKENAADLHIVYYEDLVLTGAEALRPAFESWGWEELPASLHGIMGQPSSTTHDWADLESVEGKLGRWRNELEQISIERILHIAYYIEENDYNNDVLPKFMKD